MKPSIQQILAQVPKACPVCGAPTILSDDYCHLTCSNDSCEGKFARKLEIFAKALDMEYFGQANCSLISTKISAFNELFAMTVPDIISCGIGAGVAEIIYKNIHKCTSFPLHKFLAALCIPKVGPETAKLLANTYKSLDAILNVSALEIVMDIERAGEESARKLVKGIADAKNEIQFLLKHISVEDITSKVQSTSMAGLLICITGPMSVDRIIWKEKIEASGGKFSSSVSKNTSCLICNSDSSTSSKFRKAKELNIPIYKEDWLVSKLQTS